MAFASAVFDGVAELEGLRGLRCEDLPAALACLETPDCIPLLVVEGEEITGQGAAPLAPAVVVDARMRKKQQAPEQRHEAALVIGIGPGFVAGGQVHAVVESNWGPALGEVIWQGSALDYTGQHQVVEGHGKERYIYSPRAGTFHTELDILQQVRAGEVVGRVEDTPLEAPISGILRGLAHGGIRVDEGAKLVEVEPRGEARYCIGIGERPGLIADGVLRAVREKVPHLF